jgi:hypothetical protein
MFYWAFHRLRTRSEVSFNYFQRQKFYSQNFKRFPLSLLVVQFVHQLQTNVLKLATTIETKDSVYNLFV